VVADIGARSVAFPAISCGIYGWKPAEAAPIALGAVREMLTMLPNVTLVQFVLFNDNTFEAFQRAARELIDV